MLSIRTRVIKIYHVNTLILVCGPAAIGKSTFCARYAAEHSGEFHTIAADEVRKELYGGYDKFPPHGNMMVVYEEMVRRAKEFIKGKDGVSVVLDTTMLYDERRLFFVRHLKEFDKKILILLKLHDYSICLVRNKSRSEDKWVPEDIILNMASHYEDPSEECLRAFDEYRECYVD